MANPFEQLEFESFCTYRYETDLTRRLDAVFGASGYAGWIDAAWGAMLLKQGLFPSEYAATIAAETLEFLQSDPRNREFAGLQKRLAEKLGIGVAGGVMMGRTYPPAQQMLPCRHQYMKLMCLILDFRESLLEAAAENLDAVMPGYTHLRQAQPTTYGHYLLSVHDPVERIERSVDEGYRGLSLNEMGCGALAGTSLPIDRDLVTTYLGFEDLVENCNDAVSYTDGYVTAVGALANLMSVVSRLALDLNMWSMEEMGFLDVPWPRPPQDSKHGPGKAHSFMMPNKTANNPPLERVRVGAAELSGCLTEVLSMGMRTPQADMHEMLHFREGTLRAIRATHTYLHPLVALLPRITVHRERMLEDVRRGYSCATELLNVLATGHALDHRTAHEVVHEFVAESKRRDVPASEARIDLLQEAAQDALGRRLEMNEEELRRNLDPEHFVHVTGSRGGVAPEETGRMLSAARERLKDSRRRHEERIRRVEKGREKLIRDLRELSTQR